MSVTVEMAHRLEEALVPQSTAVFFDSLDAADRAAADAAYNAELAETAPLPDKFGRCVCGSEYSVADSRIVLGPMELHVAADAAAARYGMKASDSDVYYHQVSVIIDAINAAREQTDIDFINNWNDSHAYCGDDL
jgi:hypothetical protein